jgi:hypothetical protein
MKNPSDFTIEDIIARKKQGRREMAKMSFTEKLLLLEQMRTRYEPFVTSREVVTPSSKNMAAGIT